jgi:glycosyltransferase involved in cell wall biosynthesis
VTRELRVDLIDRRIPVAVLNLLWHRAEWPPVEAVAERCDVVHSAHPLLIPARRAAQVITIHDLFFLSQPGRTEREIRRDYATLTPSHAHRAHAVITSTEHGKRLVIDQLGVARERIYVCRPGAPRWKTLGGKPNVPRDGYLLFVGTLEARKNIGALLDAYALLLQRMPSAPPLVLAGRATPDAAGWLARLERAPLAGHARHLGYVPGDGRETLYAGARALVLTSLDEGFGLTALEAMSAGVPVVASNRGSLPEVVGSGGTLLDPGDLEGFAGALHRVSSDDDAAAQAGAAGLTQARTFTWDAAAAALRRAYVEAIKRRSSASS